MKSNDELLSKWQSSIDETKNLAKDLGLNTISEKKLVPFTDEQLNALPVEELETMLGGMIKHEDWAEAEIVKKVLENKLTSNK